MPTANALPWDHAALQLLDLRAQDRVLAVSCGPRQVRDLLALIGRRGQLTVVHEQRAMAEAIADLDLPQVDVLAHRVDGSETFGVFDALLVMPSWGPLLPVEVYAEMARVNLRPGGRCVVDVPATDMVPDLSAASEDLGWPRQRLAALRGVGDDALAQALRRSGMRGVKALLGSHLVHVVSPHEILDLFVDALLLGTDERLELDRALVRRSGGMGPADALVHRTRLQAIR
jgi:SAM-dependent methyltransferase